MTTSIEAVFARAAHLRQSFDRSFTTVPQCDDIAWDDFLAIRVAEDAYVLRLAALSGLLVDRRIIPVPSAAHGFLGVTGIRGNVVSVYSLRALLGYPLEHEPPRWLVVTGMEQPVGLAFDRFDGHLRVRRDAIAPRRDTTGGSLHTPDVLRGDGMVLPVVDVDAVVATMTQEIHTDRSFKEP